MADVGQNKGSTDEAVLRLRALHEYTRYLYEEERNRATGFSTATKTYLLFIGSTFAASVAALKWMAVEPTEAISSVTTYMDVLLLGAVLLATLSLLVSFLFTILVIKVWQRERLCSPKSFVLSRVQDETEHDLLVAMIANFVVATERNSEINERKASPLRGASQAYRVALILLTLSALIYVIDKVLIHV